MDRALLHTALPPNPIRPLSAPGPRAPILYILVVILGGDDGVLAGAQPAAAAARGGGGAAKGRRLVLGPPPNSCCHTAAAHLLQLRREIGMHRPAGKESRELYKVVPPLFCILFLKFHNGELKAALRGNSTNRAAEKVVGL